MSCTHTRTPLGGGGGGGGDGVHTHTHTPLGGGGGGDGNELHTHKHTHTHAIMWRRWRRQRRAHTHTRVSILYTSIYTVYESPLRHSVYSKQQQYTSLYTVYEPPRIRSSAYTNLLLYEAPLHLIGPIHKLRKNGVL